MERALEEQIPGIGQTVIRGLDTDRLMVRRELCHLIAWIAARSCANIVSSQIARTFQFVKAPSRHSQHQNTAALPPFPHTQPHRRPAVKGKAATAVRSTLDSWRTVWHWSGRLNMVRHHPPYETGQFSCNCGGSNIVLFPGKGHFGVLPFS